MAKVELLAPKIFGWEGGWSDHQNDKGGKTNMGVTLETWKSCGYDKDGDHDIDADDLKLITKADAAELLRKYYWNRWQADLIKNQSIANLLVDWVWGSGKWGIIIPQRILGVKQDGLVGAQTLNALNTANQQVLFKQLWDARVDFILNICQRDPSQNVFKRGWLNRLNDFKFSA
jgi:lysozyme family protein